MDARKLLEDWPNEALASADGIFQSPAWRKAVEYDGAPCMLVKAETPSTDILPLALTFDGVPSVLGIADSPCFPDLHLLWSRRDELPREVLLALVEKECGAIFQMLEEVTKQLVAVKGFSSVEACAQAVAFTFMRPDGEKIDFTLTVTPEQRANLGTFDNLDLTHEAIRVMTRRAWAQYVRLGLSAADCAHLAIGDCLLLPEEEESVWLPELADDGAVRICASEEGMLTFAELADETLPPIPPALEVSIFQGKALLAKGRVDRLCEQQIVRVDEIHRAN